MPRWMVYKTPDPDPGPHAVQVEDDCVSVYVPREVHDAGWVEVDPNPERFWWASVVEADTEAAAMHPDAQVVGGVGYVGSEGAAAEATPRPS